MQRAFSKKRVLAMLALSVSSVWLGQAHADTPVSWANAGASGNWSVAADWTPTVSPNGAYAVTLPTGSETVTLDVSPTIDSLVLGSGATLKTNAGTSLASGSLNNSGTALFASGSTFTISGTATNSGGIDTSSGTTVSITGNVTNSAGFSTGFYAGGNNKLNVSGTFNNTGTLELISGGDVANVNALNNQATMVLNGGTTLNITGGGLGVTDVPGGSQYVIGGTFNIINSAVTSSALAHLASVEGTLRLGSGQSYNFGPLTDSGGIDVSAGTTLSITGNVTNSGGFSTGFYAGGNNKLNVSGTFSNTGTLELISSGDVVNVNTLNNKANLVLDGGTSLHIGSGSFSASSGYQQLANGTFDEIIGGAGTFGTANISGPMALGGTLDVTLVNGFMPALGESFTFLDGTPNELSGAYASVVGQPFAGGQWLVGYNDAAGTVTLTAAVPEPTSIAILCVSGFGLLRRRRRSVQQ
ncbi:MAG: PEP-CTERM sorting domain-containing protein [Planctomycetota bacterium]|nr:PEP-CTERM sorting domain-containing protein [Planctomycetota bacterium]